MDKTLKIKISVDKDTGTVSIVGREFEGLSRKVKETDDSVSAFGTNIKTLAASLAGLYSVKEITTAFIKNADAMNMLDARLKLATGSMEEFARQQQALYDVSKSSFSDIKDITTLYVKLDPALKQVGATTDGATKVTSDFAKALKLGGASAQESSSAILQFAQAMGSGVLRGEEFNAIAEASPKLMAYLAKGLGVPQTALRGLAEEGTLTADKVSVALLKMSSEIDADFKKLPLTVSNATVNLTTDMQKIAQEMDTATGISSSLALAINGLSGFMKENVDVTVSYFSNSYADASVTAKALSSAVGDIGKSFYDIASPIATFGENFVGLQDMAVGVVAAFGVVSASVQNAAKVFENAGLQIQNWKKYLSFDEDKEAFIAANEKLIDENRKQIKMLEELGQAGYDAGMKLRKAFADNQHEADVRQSAQVYKEFNEQIKDLLKDDFSIEDEIYKIQHSKKAQTQEEIKKALELKKKYQEEIKKMDDKSHLYFLDNQAKEALETYQHYEALKEEYKTVAGARDKLITLQNQELKNIETKQLAVLNEEKLKLQKKFVDDANALVEKKNAFYLDGLTKEALETYEHYNSLIEEYKTIAGAEQALRTMQGEALDDINKKIEEQNRLAAQKTLIDSLDEINDRYQKILESQISLLEAGQDWNIDLGKPAKDIENISKSIFKMHAISLKYTKDDLRLQNDYAKKYLEANGDIEKEKQAMSEFDEDSAKLKDMQMRSEIAGYSALAGSMSQAFTEGSDAAKAFMAVQQGLALYNSVTAVTAAWASAPFPANLPAVAATTAAVISLLAQIGTSFSGSSGSGGVPVTSTGFTFEQNREQIEGSYEPMTDRLDRQIELLESIDRQGSASQLGIELAATSFERDAKIWIEDVLEKARQGFVNGGGVTQEQISGVNAVYGADVFQMSGTKVAYNADVLREGTNLIKTLITASETGAYTGTLYQGAALKAGYNWSNMLTYIDIEIEKDINEYQNLVHDWSMGVLESMNDLKDAAKDFKGYYDDVTGSMFYETARLKQAYAEVDALRGENSFADYLQQSINSIESLQTFFNDEVFTLLSSQDINDIEAQIAKVEELQTVTGKTFEGGAREALNYLESIELVAEAMTRSRENIKDFLDSLKTDEQLAADVASAHGTTLASTVDELAAMFIKMSGDTEGLTDSELELLNANKALLENTDKYQTQIDSLNVTLEDVTGNISTLDGALGVIQSTIDKLRSASLTSEQSLQIFYDAMAEAQALSTTTTYEKYADAVKKATDASSILFNTSAFQTSQDMRFAQLVAANQFEDLQAVTMTEVDYLKQIEINTRTQIDVLVEAMNSLGSNVSEGLASSIAAMQTISQTPVSSTASYIKDIYTKYDLHQYQTDTSGYAYWEQQVASGAVAVQDLDQAIKAAAIERLKYTPFADGGIVTAPTFSLIGEAGYPEAVIPLKNPNDPLNQNALLAEMKALREEVAQLRKESNKNQTQISKNTAASRYAS